MGGMGGIFGILGIGSIFITFRRMYWFSTNSPMYRPFLAQTEPSCSIHPRYVLLESKRLPLLSKPRC